MATRPFVRELCAQYGLPLCVEHAYFDGESGNIEAAGARNCVMQRREGMFANYVPRRGRRERRRASVLPIPLRTARKHF